MLCDHSHIAHPENQVILLLSSGIGGDGTPVEHKHSSCWSNAGGALASEINLTSEPSENTALLYTQAALSREVDMKSCPACIWLEGQLCQNSKGHFCISSRPYKHCKRSPGNNAAVARTSAAASQCTSPPAPSAPHQRAAWGRVGVPRPRPPPCWLLPGPQLLLPVGAPAPAGSPTTSEAAHSAEQHSAINSSGWADGRACGVLRAMHCSACAIQRQA